MTGRFVRATCTRRIRNSCKPHCISIGHLPFTDDVFDASGYSNRSVSTTSANIIIHQTLLVTNNVMFHPPINKQIAKHLKLTKCYNWGICQ